MELQRFLLILTICLANISNAEFQQSLEFTDILPLNVKSYDKMRPPKKDGQPTIVFFHVTVMGLDSIDETSMTYAADIFFAQTWKDHRLRLPENMTAEYRLLEVDWLKQMWRPDSFFKNAKAVIFQTMTIPNHYLWLYKDKTILYMVKLTLKLSCVMNFAIYPHDTQECKLQMESLSHTTDDMIFQWDPDVPLVVDESIELPQLALTKNYTADCTQIYSTGNFTCLEVIFVLKRRLVYYFLNTYIPTCMIVIMSWVSFWIKPEAAPARVTLGVTSLLTLSTQHAKSQASLPPVSYLKAVDAFMSVCTVFVFMALMEYCLINMVLGTQVPKPAAPPKPPEEQKKEEAAKTETKSEKIEKIEKIFDELQAGNRKKSANTGVTLNPTPTVSLGAPSILAHANRRHQHHSHHHAHSHNRHDPSPVRLMENNNSPEGPWIPRQESRIILTPIVAPPPSLAQSNKTGAPTANKPEQKKADLPKLTPAQQKLKMAINIDRFSRIFFPFLFAMLNLTYWIVFWEYL